MITIRSKALFLCACFIEATWLLVAQTLGSIPILLPCLACFLALVAWAAIENVAMPVMLFFLPFATLLKIRPGTISFFTLALLVIYIIYTIGSIRNIRIHHLVPALCLVAMTLIVKTLYGYDIDNSYILFSVTLMLVPFLTRELDADYSFFWLTLFFALGIALAAITAQYLIVFPSIMRYIDINTTLGVVRRSGYYGDPNFYSSHITAALGGILILFSNNEKKRKLFLLMLLIVLLLYCGLMSVSKSFLLVSVFMLLVWFVDLLFRKGKVSIKLTLIFILIITTLFLLSSTMFTDMLDAILTRFSNDNNWSDFTTGRTELWKSYINTMVEDPLLLLFGKGYTGVIVGGRGSHNTLIQCVFQFGLVGCILFLGWMVCFIRILLDKAVIRWDSASQIAILLLGVFGPWMALELLFFDELFLMPVYVCAAIRFLSDRKQVTRLLIEEKSVG